MVRRNALRLAQQTRRARGWKFMRGRPRAQLLPGLRTAGGFQRNGLRVPLRGEELKNEDRLVEENLCTCMYFPHVSVALFVLLLRRFEMQVSFEIE